MTRDLRTSQPCAKRERIFIMNTQLERVLASKYQKVIFSVGAMVLAGVVGAVMIALNRQNPLTAYGALLRGAFGTQEFARVQPGCR